MPATRGHSRAVSSPYPTCKQQRAVLDAGRQVAKNPGIAGVLTSMVESAAQEHGASNSWIAAQPEQRRVGAWYLDKSKAVSNVPVPPCHGVIKQRWLRFIQNIHIDAALSERLRVAILEAAKYIHKEQQLVWSPVTLKRARTRSPAAIQLTHEEQRMAAGILAQQLPYSSLHATSTSPSRCGDK
jgi:hypothetical protein